MVRMRSIGFHYSLQREMLCKWCFPHPSLVLSSASLSLPFQSCFVSMPRFSSATLLLIFTFLSFWLSSSSVLSHSHPHAIFSPSAFSCFSFAVSVQQGKRRMHRTGSFFSCQSLILMPFRNLADSRNNHREIGVQFLQKMEQANWTLREFGDIRCQRRELEISVEMYLY